MVPPTLNSSARCRVWNMTPLNAVMLELGKAYRGAANPRLFRSLSEFIETDVRQCAPLGRRHHIRHRT